MWQSTVFWQTATPLAVGTTFSTPGTADLVQVARDILGLTKLNYNSCQPGESQPITVKYSDGVGEILLSRTQSYRQNFPLAGDSPR